VEVPCVAWNGTYSGVPSRGRNLKVLKDVMWVCWHVIEVATLLEPINDFNEEERIVTLNWFPAQCFSSNLLSVLYMYISRGAS